MASEVIKGPTLGMRHVQAFLIFFNLIALYMSRLNISVALVAMTNAETTNPDFPEFNCSEQDISYILSSFFWGYIFSQFPGAFLCKRFGPKRIIGWSTFISTVLTALTPWSVGWGGWQIFCAIRVIQGLVQGVVFPCIYAHMAQWSPVEERNRLGAFSVTGMDCGTVLAMAISGIIAEGSMGWPGISYVSAGICFTWCAFWLAFGANNPCESKFITEAEKHYIESSLAHTEDYYEKKIPVPWKAIFTSVPFYALLIARIAETWGLSTLQAQIPSYLNGVLNIEIKANGLFSALPFLAMWAMACVYLLVADVLQRKKVLTLTSLRRVFNSISFWLPALGLIGIGFLDEDNKPFALALMTICVALNSGHIIGSGLNIIDLSANHASYLMAIINTIATVPPFLSPLLVGVIVTDTSNRCMWQIVFGIAAAIFFIGNLIYILFGTTDKQPWDAEDFLLKCSTSGNAKNVSDAEN